MSEFEILKNMLDRNDAKYTIDSEEDYNEDIDETCRTNYLCIPAVQDEFLILGFDEDGDLIYVDAGADWDEYLKRRGE